MKINRDKFRMKKEELKQHILISSEFDEIWKSMIQRGWVNDAQDRISFISEEIEAGIYDQEGESAEIQRFQNLFWDHYSFVLSGTFQECGMMDDPSEVEIRSEEERR